MRPRVSNENRRRGRGVICARACVPNSNRTTNVVLRREDDCRRARLEFCVSTSLVVVAVVKKCVVVWSCVVQQRSRFFRVLFSLLRDAWRIVEAARTDRAVLAQPRQIASNRPARGTESQHFARLARNARFVFVRAVFVPIRGALSRC